MCMGLYIGKSENKSESIMHTVNHKREILKIALTPFRRV